MTAAGRRLGAALAVLLLAAAATPAGAGTVERTALIVLGNPLRVLDERGGVVWQGTDDGYWLQWSPDGERFTYMDDEFRMVVVDRSTWQATPLPGVPALYAWPAWSPEGKRIAFVGPEEDREVFVTPADRCCARPVSTFDLTGQEPWAVDWTPDGRRLVVFLNAFPTDRLVSLDPRSGEAVPLSETHGGYFDVSPVDGSIAVVANVEGSMELWRLDADGSDPRRLATGAIAHTFPAWSPNGQWVAFHNETGLAVVRADGTDGRQLTAIPDWGSGDPPSWLPDSRRVVYTTEDGWQNREPSVVVVSLSGGRPRLVTEATFISGMAPHVAPVFVAVT